MATFSAAPEEESVCLAYANVFTSGPKSDFLTLLLTILASMSALEGAAAPVNAAILLSNFICFSTNILRRPMFFSVATSTLALANTTCNSCCL